MSVWDNVKEMKAWILGAIAFDASVTTLLVTIFEVAMVTPAYTWKQITA